MGGIRRGVTAACFAAACGSVYGLHPEAEALVGKGDPGDGARFGDFPSHNVTLLSQVPLAALDPLSIDANDCWGYVTPEGREIAIIGLRKAFAFVDVTNPYDPVVLAVHQSWSSLWHDIKVIGDRAYGVNERRGHIQVFDLSQADQGVITNLGYTIYGGRQATHNIAANPESGYLYRAGGGESIRAYGVGVAGAPGTPDAPAETLINPGFYVHDAQVVTYTTGPFAGREIGFLFTASDGLRVWDLTDKSAPFQMALRSYPNLRYCHQGWLSEDRRHLYINDELDEQTFGIPTTMRIFNVENPANPVFVRSWTNGNTAIDHNLYVRGRHIFASNYTSGLRIHDISDPVNPVEVAWIDTFPANDAPTYDGTWSNYPFFPSGNVVISDMASGLLVVRPEIDVLRVELVQTPGATLPSAGGATVLASIEEVGVELDETSPALFVRLNDGTVIETAGSYADGLATFQTPALPCREAVEWWVGARSVAGRAFGAPAELGYRTVAARVADEVIAGFADNAESDPGWTVSGDAAAGHWERGVPVNAGRGDPTADADGSGRAWVTGNSSANGGNADVDAGETVLTSPPIQSIAGGTVSYSYWLSDIAGSELGPEDALRVEVLASNGVAWQAVRTHSAAGNDWRRETLVIGEDFPLAPSFRIRFIASDGDPGNVVEAGIDAVVVEGYACDGEPCANRADVNGDGALMPNDFAAWVAAFNAGSPAADQNGDGLALPNDFAAWIANYNAGGCL
jgi:choice-of-anchor B domain-containing protein